MIKTLQHTINSYPCIINDQTADLRTGVEFVKFCLFLFKGLGDHFSPRMKINNSQSEYIHMAKLKEFSFLVIYHVPLTDSVY